MADLPIKELGDEAPVYDRPSRATRRSRRDRRRVDATPPMPHRRRAAKADRHRPTCARKRWVWEQYDHVILGNTVQRPGGDAAVVRVDDGPKALALTADVTPRYCEADPFEGGKQAVAEAWRNLTAVGAQPLAITDNLNFGNPERPEIMGQFVGCVRGIAEACKALDFPVVSGNVSLYNETNGRAILPTPTHRRRRPARRFHQVGDARLQGRGRGDPAGRRDRRAGSASRSICATSAAARRARRRRSISSPSARNGDFVRALIARGARHRGARPVRRRPPGGARRNGDGVRHRRELRRGARRCRRACVLVRRGSGALRRDGAAARQADAAIAARRQGASVPVAAARHHRRRRH